MSCKYWKKEDSYCIKKQKTINYDEPSDCIENCPDYLPLKISSIMICNSCGSEFPLIKKSVVEVKGKKYIKCSFCGSVVNLERADDSLGKGIY